MLLPDFRLFFYSSEKRVSSQPVFGWFTVYPLAIHMPFALLNILTYSLGQPGIQLVCYSVVNLGNKSRQLLVRI